jgi:uroporphyrinogen decarboxylase
MTGFDRVQAAMQFQRPDRLPVTMHNFLPATAATGRAFPEVLRDGELLAEAVLAAWREFGHDMIQLENGTVCSAEACGVEVHYQDESPPALGRPALERLEDVAALAVPDPYTTFPMNELLRAARIVSREIQGKAWLCARADQGPFSLATQIYGVERLMIEVGEDARGELIHALLDYCRRVTTRFALALKECGGHSTSIGDSIAGPDVLAPRMYRKYAWVHEQAMAEELSANSLPLHIHICGNASRIAQDFVATGARVLEVDHKTDARLIKDAARGRACLLGNIDTNTFAFGKAWDIADAVRELIPVWAPDGGCIVSPGCGLGSNTPAANIHAMIEAVRMCSDF